MKLKAQRHGVCSQAVQQNCHARCVCAGIAGLVVLAVSLAAAQSNKPTEYDVKAAYLFNFAKFVKWPGSAASGRDTFPICILGDDPFGQALESTVSGERIDGKPVILRHIMSAGNVLNCRILFVSSSEQKRIPFILSSIGRAPVLTVSDTTGFADHKGMIEFVMDHERVRFQVNLSAAERAGLTLSSNLLKVATSVKREGQSGE